HLFFFIALLDGRSDYFSGSLGSESFCEPLAEGASLPGEPSNRKGHPPGGRVKKLLEKPLLVSEFTFCRLELFAEGPDEFVLLIELRIGQLQIELLTSRSFRCVIGKFPCSDEGSQLRRDSSTRMMADTMSLGISAYVLSKVFAAL